VYVVCAWCVCQCVLDVLCKLYPVCFVVVGVAFSVLDEPEVGLGVNRDEDWKVIGREGLSCVPCCCALYVCGYCCDVR
jgi:hypothetical protein